MDIAIMTSSFRERRNGGPEEIPYPESIARCKAAGFNILDMNLCSMRFPERNVFCRDNWEEYLEEVLAAKEKYQVSFCQSHPIYRAGIDALVKPGMVQEYYDKMTYRGLRITAAVGAPWAVIHPVYDPDLTEVKDLVELNKKVYGPAAELAADLGIGLAFENMVQHPGADRRFGAFYTDLLAIVDGFGMDNIGCCWDFGHAHQTRPEEQPEDIRALGSNLKVCHLDDNKGKIDDHFVPFQGTIAWEKIMPVLTEINFPGHLDLEVCLTGNMPDPLKDAAVRFAAETAKELLKLA